MKKIIFIFLIVHCTLIIENCLSQVTQEWVKNYPGPSNDLYGPFLAVDKQGNSYIAGTHVINDSINILCVKYNTSGTQIWATLYKYPGDGYFAPSGLALDTSGNAYVTSISGLSTFYPLNSLLVKFSNSNGVVLWAKKYIGQYGSSEPLDIKIDRFNNIYVAGWSDTSHLLIKYNTNGDSIWVRKYNPPGIRDLGYACTIDDSLNVILTGRRRYCLVICFDTVFTAKYNASGDLEWIRTYHYDNVLNFGSKIAADQFGSVYIAGQSRISGFLVYLTLKYDRNGVQQWASIYNGPGGGDDNIRAISIDRTNNCVTVTGAISGSSNKTECGTIKYNATTGDSIWIRRDTGTYSNAGASDIKTDAFGYIYITGGTYTTPPSTGALLTTKYTSQGSTAWQVTYNGAGRGQAIGLDTSRNIYICGYYENNYIVIKYSQFSGIRPISNSIPKNFKLGQNFPNPFNPVSRIRFSIPKNSSVQLRIYDVLGRMKEMPVNKQLRPSEYEIIVEASNYTSGVYFYQLIADGNIVDTKKLVVLK